MKEPRVLGSVREILTRHVQVYTGPAPALAKKLSNPIVDAAWRALIAKTMFPTIFFPERFDHRFGPELVSTIACLELVSTIASAPSRFPLSFRPHTLDLVEYDPCSDLRMAECNPPGKAPSAPSAAPAQRLAGRDPGLVGQGVRFGLTGGLTALVYLVTTSLLALVFGAPFEIALTIGFLSAAAFNFAMQRIFVWAGGEGYALPLHHQAGRYLSLAAAQYGVTLATTSLLPGALALPTEAVYLVTVALLAGVNFIVLRHRIFHSTRMVPTARLSL